MRVFDFDYELPLDDAFVTGAAFEDILSGIQQILLARPSTGFRTRLYVLFALEILCIVSGIAYLIVTFVDYQRRGKRFWLWRFVHRSEGRVIVGNQHVLFTLFGTISCITLVGYTNDALLTFSKARDQQTAFFWRTMIYVPIIVHGWISSFANLQASLLSSQKLLNKNVLPPLWLNSIYIGGLTVLLVVTITLNIHASLAWEDVWHHGLVITKTIMLAEQELKLGDLDPAVVESIKPEIYALDDKFTFFDKAEQAVGGFYIVTMACMIAINIIGLSLVLTLRRQIHFNTGRFAAGIRSVDPLTSANAASALRSDIGISSPGVAPLPMETVIEYDEEREIRAIHAIDLSLAQPHSPDSLDGVVMIEKVAFRKDRPSNMSASRIRKESVMGAGAAANDLREQGKNLLAMKKIKSDVVVLIAAITLLSFILLGVGLWIAIGPSKIYRHWPSIEASLFLFPWAYTVVLALAHCALLYNNATHLTPSSETSVPCYKAILPSTWRRLAKETVSGLSSVTGTAAQPGLPAGSSSGKSVSLVAVQTTVEVREDRDEDSSNTTAESDALQVKDRLPHRNPDRW